MGVTILAVLAAIAAPFAFLAGLFMMAIGSALAMFGSGMYGALGASAGAFLLGYSVLCAAVSWGLFRRAKWGWYGALVLIGLQGALGVVSLVQGAVTSGIMSMAVAGLVAWYLLTPAVQTWFGASVSVPWNQASQPAR